MSEETPLVRQWILLRMLSALHHGASVKELAQEMGVSEKTIRRDLECFQQAGFPLAETVEEHGRKKWHVNPDRGQPGLSFTLDEAIALYLARRLMEPLAGTLFWDAVQRAFRKIKTMLGPQALKYVGQFGEMFHQTTVGVSDYTQSSGIETTLSYPTLDEFTFQWLRVRVSLSAVLKGRIDKGHIYVAMLAVKANNGRPLFIVNGPLMIHPKVGDKYVMFLASTPKKGLYASIFAPYDEENAVFILDRDSPRYSMEGVSKAPEVKDYRDFRQEIRDMIWILVDDVGEMTPDGIERFRAKYGRELQVSSEGRTMPLEWKKHTSNTGWSWDVPKNKASTAEQDGD